MISTNVVWAIVVRHMRVYRRDFNLLLSILYWPLLDVLTWGFLGAWVSQSTTFENFETVLLLGILLWQIVGRGSNILVFSLTEEFWNNNMVNLFSLPLRIIEWILGVIIFYAIIICLTSLFCIGITIYFYDVSVLQLLTTFWIFCLPLFFSGIWLGFTAFCIIILFGKRSIELGHVITWFLLPFTGAYYPIEILPVWAQKLSVVLPMSYVFAGMREYLIHKKDPTFNWMVGFVLSLLYAAIAIVLFVYCFNRSKKKGLARLAD